MKKKEPTWVTLAKQLRSGLGERPCSPAVRQARRFVTLRNYWNRHMNGDNLGWLYLSIMGKGWGSEDRYDKAEEKCFASCAPEIRGPASDRKYAGVIRKRFKCPTMKQLRAAVKRHKRLYREEV